MYQDPICVPFGWLYLLDSLYDMALMKTRCVFPLPCWPWSESLTERPLAFNPTDPALPVQPAARWDWDPEQPQRNVSEDERQREETWRGGGAEAKTEEALAEQERPGQPEDEAPDPNSRFVSRSLMSSLWATFKSARRPALTDILSLSFEFNMTQEQVSGFLFLIATCERFLKAMS